MTALDRPRIEQRTPENLVREVQRGVVRIPQFQRGFTWEAGDVVKLFDSILRGFPIGNLLLWWRPAPAQTLHVGPLTIKAPELDSALWVVDGQQRITPLVGALTAALTATDLRFRVHPADDVAAESPLDLPDHPLRHSLAGVQLKFSVATDRLTSRVSGRWLVDRELLDEARGRFEALAGHYAERLRSLPIAAGPAGA